MATMPVAEAWPVMVTLPAEIDITNAGNIREQIAAAALKPGVTIVVADMTGTIFCDSTGVRELMVARERAARNGAELRLLQPGPAVMRTLELLGADKILPIYDGPRRSPWYGPVASRE